MLNIHTKICIYCNKTLPIDSFNKDRSRKDGCNPRCRECYKIEKSKFWEKHGERISKARKVDYDDNIEFYRAQKRKWREKNKERENLRMKEDRKNNPLKYKNYSLKRDFGITLADYQLMCESQSKVCKICKKANGYKDLAVDHSHKSGEIRGLLCENCNKGLGMFHDDIELFNAAINYLKENADGS